MGKDSIYCYPDTNILRNKFGCRDPERLNELEANVVGGRIFLLSQNPIGGHFDLHHLKKIHSYLFQDLYEWAGQIRKMNMTKYYQQLEKVKGFGFVQYIESYLEDVFRQLQKEDNLTNCTNHKIFAERCAYYMSEINAAHPFREGNGRTQREFFRCLAQNAGYDLDWTQQPEQALTKARALSLDDYTYLGEMIKNCITNETRDSKLPPRYRRESF